MTTALADSVIMLRRNFKHMLRYPSVTLFMILMPVAFLLLFVYILGGTIGPAGHTGRAAYATFITPGILVLTEVAATTATAGVGGAVIQTVLGMVAVTALALLTGFRATTSATDWLAAAAILILFTFALTWLSVALGLAAKSVESASNAPTPLIILAFLGSGFVLTQSMPTAIRWFAEYQPFTPVINTVRGLLIGAPIGHNGVIAIAWCLVITVGSHLWARKLFSRDPVQS